MHALHIVPFFPYQLFFLYVEPISAILGAIYAARPATYLSMITMASKPAEQITVPMETTISLFQLANLYLLFALNEHLVLRSADSLKTWRRLLFCLLVADFGHLITMYPLGIEVYWKFWEWNAMHWGSIGFVYAGASMRLSFLFGLGLKVGVDTEVSRRSKPSAASNKNK